MLSKYRKMVSNKRLKELAFLAAVLILPGGIALLGFRLAQSSKVRDLLKKPFNRRNKC